MAKARNECLRDQGNRLTLKSVGKDALVAGLFLQEPENHQGMLHGYEFMHLTCIQSGLVVTQKTEQHLLQTLDSGVIQLKQWNPVTAVKPTDRLSLSAGSVYTSQDGITPVCDFTFKIEFHLL